MIESQKRLVKVIARLKQHGHRMTPQRMAVLKILFTNRKHLSAEQIYDCVKEDYPMTSLATIYKTLTVLKEIGEVSEHRFSDDTNRYEGNPRPHPHLICVKCKKILEIDVDVLRALPMEKVRETGYKIMSHRFDLFGLCPQCQSPL